MSSAAPQPSTPAYVTFLSGSVAAVGATFVKQPLDRLKWLRQVSEGQSNISRSSYFNVFRTILRTERIPGLFRGVTATVFRNIPHAALIYTFFPKLKRRLSNTQLLKHSSQPLINTITGSLASIAVTCITHPSDTLRVRYTAQFAALRYQSYPMLFAAMRQEGFTSFYRGLTVSCIGTAFRGGLGLGLYETLKSEELKKRELAQSVLNRLGIGYLAGFVSTVASYPVGTVKRRMQVWSTYRALTETETKHFGSVSPEYVKNARTLFWHIWRTEGVMGYFKGLGVTMIKTPLASGVSLTLNDIVKRALFDEKV